MRLPYPAYYTYIVECADGTYYTGKTYDIHKRLKQHNGFLSGGAKYTRLRRPVKVVHCEPYVTNKCACQREAEIKRLSHQQKKQLIGNALRVRSWNFSSIYLRKPKGRDKLLQA